MTKKVNNRYKQTYHANVPSGWSNDPNGMIYYDGKAHLFFQHYPHDSKWGPMHWGHMVTEDYIHWKSLPVALIPNEDYEAICGCCSGNAVDRKGKLYLMYTAAQPDRQRQCLAVSTDGVHFSKLTNNPVLTAEDLSDEVSTRDFRDPKIFEKDGWYYCLAGTRIISDRYRDLVTQLKEKQKLLLEEIGPVVSSGPSAGQSLPSGSQPASSISQPDLSLSGKVTSASQAFSGQEEDQESDTLDELAFSFAAGQDQAKSATVTAPSSMTSFSGHDDLSSEAVRHLESELGELTSEAVHHLAAALESSEKDRNLKEKEIIEKVEEFLNEVDRAVIDAAQEHQEEAENRADPLTKESVHSTVISPSDLAVLGGELEVLGYGNIILFRSKDLINWDYRGKLLLPQEGFSEEYFTLDGVYECPDYIELDGQEIIMASPQMLPQMGNDYENIHSCVYMAGSLDLESGRFLLDQIREIDAGFDFYAPQVWNAPDGRKIMIAWKEMWDRTYPTQEDNWVGTYTLPRELSYKDGHLYQAPVREIFDCRQNEVTMPGLALDHGSVSLANIRGNVMELNLTIDPETASQAGVKVFKGSDHETLIYYDKDKKAIIADRTASGLPISGREDNTNVRTCDLEEKEAGREISLQLFLDVSSVEVFINGGRHVMTVNVYPDPDDQDVEFFCQGGSCLFKDIRKYDLLVVEES